MNRRPTERQKPRSAALLRAIPAACLTGLLLAACSSGGAESTQSRADASGLVVPRPQPARPRSNNSQPTRSTSQLPAGYHLGKPYQIKGKWYHPRVDTGYDQLGFASWYGTGFGGRSTANGETFDANQLTAAHPTLPLPSLVRVTNLGNGRSVVVRVNDRGPFVAGRIIDLSKRAGDALAMRQQGQVKVRVRYIGLAPLKR